MSINFNNSFFQNDYSTKKGVIRFQPNDEKIFVKSKGSIHIIFLKEICYIERVGRKSIINLYNSRQIMCNESLKNLYQTLCKHNFFRSHQSFIIAINQVEEIQIDNDRREYLIKLRNSKSPVLLSKLKYSELKDLLIQGSSWLVN